MGGAVKMGYDRRGENCIPNIRTPAKFIFSDRNGGIRRPDERLLGELRLPIVPHAEFAVDAHRQLEALWDPMMPLLHHHAVWPRNEKMSNAAQFQPPARTATGMSGGARVAGTTMITTIMTTRMRGGDG
jgi:hypothetical protein